MGFFSSESKSEQTSEATPWAPAVPGLGHAVGLLNQWTDKPMEFFPGQTYAGQTQAEQQAVDLMKQGAAAYPGMAQGATQAAMPALQTLLGAPQAALGMGLQDVASNPALQAQADAIQSRVNRNLQENILPQIRANEIFGPSGGVARGIAARGTSDVLSENLANLYGNAWQAGLGAETARYNQGLSSAAQGLSLAPQAAQFGLSEYTTPAQLLATAGGIERAEEQMGIDEAMARHQFSQMEPYMRGSMGMQALMQPSMAFGQTTTTGTQEDKPSTFSNIGKSLGAIGAIGGAIFGGPAGAMLGNMAGNLLGGGGRGGGMMP